MAVFVSSQNAAPGITTPQPNVTPQKGTAAIKFRTATLRKTQPSVQTPGVLSASTQLVNNVLEGVGFLTGIDLEMVATAAANIAAVAYQPDAPWSAFDAIALKAQGPDVINMRGYGLFLANLYGGYGVRNPALSADAQVYSLTAGAVATGGSFRAKLRVPISINDRSLIGLLGNQDRATKYEMRNNVSPLASIYSVLPTNAPTFVINRLMHYATLPPKMSDNNQPQQQIPAHYGVIHMLTQLLNESAPVSASTVNHFLRALGNTVRTLILTFRDSTGARTDAMLPSRITMYAGSEPVFSESSSERRKIMRDRFGFDSPAGVLAYDFTRDFGMDSGFELGDDWLNTRDLSYAQFELAYPTFVNTPGSLEVITDSLVIPAGVRLAGEM